MKNQIKYYCKWCGAEMPKHLTPECNFCWEIRHRAEQNPYLALTIVLAIAKAQTYSATEPPKAARKEQDNEHSQ